MSQTSKTLVFISVAVLIIGGITYMASSNNSGKDIDYGSDFNRDGIDEPGFESGNEQADLPAIPTATTTFATISTTTLKLYTLAEVSTHAMASDCWVVINESVYNLTPFVGNHPGGKSILKICGKDGTATFMGQHGGEKKQQQILATLKIGVLIK